MNAKYALAGEQFLTGQINWLSDPIKAVLIDTTAYTVKFTDRSLADIPVLARLGTSGTLTTRTALNGVADADNITVAYVGGNSVGAVVLFKATGTESNSTLICYMDQASGLPLPILGGTTNLVWDNGSNKIFSL